MGGLFPSILLNGQHRGSCGPDQPHPRQEEQPGQERTRGGDKEADNGRRSYVEDHFDSDWDDPLQYDCVINTGLMSFDKAAALIARHIESLS